MRKYSTDLRRITGGTARRAMLGMLGFGCVVLGCAAPMQPPAERKSVPSRQLLCKLDAQSFESGKPRGHEAAEVEAEEGKGERPDSPGEAAEFRYLQRRSENGRVPPNAVMIARADRDAMVQAAGFDVRNAGI